MEHVSSKAAEAHEFRRLVALFCRVDHPHVVLLSKREAEAKLADHPPAAEHTHTKASSHKWDAKHHHKARCESKSRQLTHDQEAGTSAAR